jgi:hypothetical protein
MMDFTQAIEKIKKEIRETPYHKGTEHHIGRLRARLARIEDKICESGVRLRQGSGQRGGYAVKKQGDATIVLVGPPSAGKSTLINRLTNAKSKVAPYAFTTVTVIPGMMVYRNARIQILDVPGLIEGAEEGKGRGREVLSVVRGSDLIILITDTKRLEAIPRIKKVLEESGIRIDQEKSNVSIEKKLSGGIIVHSNIKQDFTKETVKEIASEMGIKNGKITLKEKLTIPRLIDAFSKSRAYIKSLSVVNKIDENNIKLPDNLIGISSLKGTNIDRLQEKIWEKLELITIYLVKQDEPPTLNNPMVVKSGVTIKGVGEKISSDFLNNKRTAQVWGPGAAYPGQQVSLATKAVNGMQIRFL